MATSVATQPEVEPAKVDQAIHSMESLYRTVTGQEPPAAARFPIPVEKDPGQFVHEQLDRLLSLLEQSAWGAPVGATWSPLATLYDDEKEWILQLDLPGVERKDVEVTLEGSVITVRGQRVPQRAVRTRLGERPVGAFLRRIVLPPHQQLGEPRARLRDGVLEVRLEKQGAEKRAALSIVVD